MRRFLGRIVVNAGSSLTAGGTVLAIGVALGAVGLAEVQGSGRSPFSNGWVVFGAVLALIGALWVIGTFIAAVVATAKTEKFHDLLGRALSEGEVLALGTPDGDAIQRWGQATQRLIEAGLGGAEGRLFMSDWDLGISFKAETQVSSKVWLRMRLARLTRLMDRMHEHQVNPRFQAPKSEGS